MQKWVVFQLRKKLHAITKISKKNSSSLFVQVRSSKQCAEFFENKWVSIYSTLGNFAIKKKCSSQQLLINANKKSRKQQIVLDKIIKLSCKISAI